MKSTALLAAPRLAFPGAGGGPAVGGLALAVSSVLVLPRAQASPIALGLLVAELLGRAFFNFSLSRTFLDAVGAAPVRKASLDNSFHDQFSDPLALVVNEAYRFDQGKLVGVAGAAYAGRSDIGPKASSYNLAELKTIAHEFTLKQYGALTPISARIAITPELREGYRKVLAMTRRERDGDMPAAAYARQFRDLKSGDTGTVGIFGKTKDGAIQVAWVDADDIRL
ncbi:hypothetical protein C7C56_010345 [Massilia glaciei]|uniref:Uncharacterized protein n=1 Tax=Massilia glaciei TaxID=1524097 RepID=A0A2U2HMH1_9BURK|nr:hypothetical protein C7C56_010345 [Massilia glaciei]